jgi:hypothetical protein
MEPLSIVTPTFNEVETIGVVMREIRAAYRLDIIFARDLGSARQPRRFMERNAPPGRFSAACRVAAV